MVQSEMPSSFEKGTATQPFSVFPPLECGCRSMRLSRALCVACLTGVLVQLLAVAARSTSSALRTRAQGNVKIYTPFSSARAAGLQSRAALCCAFSSVTNRHVGPTHDGPPLSKCCWQQIACPMCLYPSGDHVGIKMSGDHSTLRQVAGHPQVEQCKIYRYVSGMNLNHPDRSLSVGTPTILTLAVQNTCSCTVMVE